MPSLVQTMVAPMPKVFAAEKRNAKGKPSLIMVNNVAGLQDAAIQVVDHFTPAFTDGNPDPGMGVQDIPRLNINVSMLACVSIQDELKDVEILGELHLTIVVPDVNCIATVAWDHQ